MSSAISSSGRENALTRSARVTIPTSLLCDVAEKVIKTGSDARCFAQ
jgi:hypothetical protein